MLKTKFTHFRMILATFERFYGEKEEGDVYTFFLVKYLLPENLHRNYRTLQVPGKVSLYSSSNEKIYLAHKYFDKF